MSRKLTPYSDVNNVLKLLLSRIRSVLGEKLVALYLGGSLVIGDFDPGISDIDLVAALEGDVDDKEFLELQKMHTDLVREHPLWDNRVEVCYISTDALQHVKSRTSAIVNISPGEPFHRKQSSKEWLMNWYLLREKSKTLFGPDPKTLVEPISKQEFMQSVNDHVRAWKKWVVDMRDLKGLAYAIVTLCRALYVHKHGEQVSKKQAAEWVQKQFPQWSGLIDSALTWRRAKTDAGNYQVSFATTKEFVDFINSKFV